MKYNLRKRAHRKECRMKLTMKDIAKATGVSQPTISRILNGSPNVNTESKIKVLEYQK